MKTVLLPVKDFKDAKQRLAATLPPDQRADLARAMLADVLRVLSHARSAERVVVFTASAQAAEMARSYHFDVVPEQSVAGHSAAVNHMVRELLPKSSRILSIAADLPMLKAEDVDFVMENAPEPITIIHSRDGTGTNGILFIPPARIEVEYGPGSFGRHLSRAAAAGHHGGVLNVPGIAFDIDTADDLTAFMSNPRRDSETWRFLGNI
ncbi:MAG: 2-phospho-L-lactate guanylyltransferase [Acidobacteria bacterium]|nr:2-phospho-L-lactate guanylyltransferase [Acidobacteriota bacterium]